MADAAQKDFGSSWRASMVLVGFFALTLPLMPLQAVFVRFVPKAARRFPHWYHRQVCRIIGVRLNIDGAVASDRPVLLISNHTSWLDIPVLSAVAPLSFVAKKEVGSWPFVSSLARLQRTVFVDRKRRMDVDQTTSEIAQRLATGDTVVLFAEGTSSDGNRVLPFKTSLFAAAKPPKLKNGRSLPAHGGEQEKIKTADGREAVVQTLSVVYTKLHGVPLSRGQRSIVGWYGDMEMLSHAWALLKAGPLDVDIRVSEPKPLDGFEDRKVLARATEKTVRQNVVATLRGVAPGNELAVIEPDRSLRHRVGANEDRASSQASKWR